MHRIRLIHWNAAESQERAAKLQAAGYTVEHGVQSLREVRQNPPDAVVIDLARLPSQGRDVALALRHFKSTRCLPIVFVDGDPQKVVRIKALLPEAVYTTWKRIRSSLQRAIAHPPLGVGRPKSLLAGYSGVPLTKKLGIKANSIVALLDAPRSFKKTLGRLPEGVRLLQGVAGQPDLILWFVRSRRELALRVRGLVKRADRGGLWILWPKKSSGIESDLSQAVVRQIGLAAGLVDFKISAIDKSWAGLRFSRRKTA